MPAAIRRSPTRSIRESALSHIFSEAAYLRSSSGIHWRVPCLKRGMTYGQNTHTLIATFADYSSARQAARELIDNGVPSDAVQLDSNQQTAGAGAGAYANEEHHKSGFAEWWDSLFGSDENDDDRRHYEGALAGGKTILRATLSLESTDSAIGILNRNGARDIEDGSTADAARTPATARASESARAGDKGSIQVVEEELQIGKRAVRRGGVRVYSHVVTEPVEQQVGLRDERVTVERRKVNREISPAEVSALQDQTIEVTEMTEEPVIAKRARVREEVVVGKEATERTETVRDDVRRTEVEVEPLGPEASVGNTATNGSPASTREASFNANDLTSDYRRNFAETYGSGYDFETMRPAYEYGYRTASDPRYRGKSWEQAENDLRSGYEQSYPGSAWDRAKNAVRYSWEKVTRQR